MDIQIVPKANIPKEEREKWKNKMNKFVENSERDFQKWHEEKVKAGYSEEEIMRMVCY
jgi:G:T-mismatch repair DNA endonuclease (very short patch repair protein)